MASQTFPEADVKTIYLAFSLDKKDWGFLTDSLLYQPAFPPSDDVLQRFDRNSDLILSPIRSKTENGLILLKRVWLVCSKEGNPVNATLKIYKKGNIPKDGSTDAPDATIPFQWQNGNIYIDTPPLLSEAFILRFQWTPQEQQLVNGRLFFAGTAWECVEWRRYFVRIYRIFVDVEEYGERTNVTGTDYGEQEW